jgi:hypothetical protein
LRIFDTVRAARIWDWDTAKQKKEKKETIKGESNLNFKMGRRSSHVDGFDQEPGGSP